MLHAAGFFVSGDGLRATGDGIESRRLKTVACRLLCYHQPIVIHSMLMNIKYSSIAAACAFSVFAIALSAVYAQEVPGTSSTSTPLTPASPMPILFEQSSSTVPLMRNASSTSPIRPMNPEMASGTREHATGTKMMPPKNQDEDTVTSSDDTPATRLRKLAKYWAVYRELGSNSMYAITVSGTKREIKTLDFFTKIESNFGMRLMPKGSLDQFQTGEAITTVEGLNLSSFRKLAQPCRLIKTADKPVVYLACLGMKRAIQSEKAFRLFGWDFKQVQTVGAGDVDAMKSGDAVSESTVFDMGVNIEAPMMQSQPTQPQASDTQEKNKPSTESAKLNAYTVIKVQGDSKIFVLGSDGKLHRILNLEVLRALKIDMSKIRIVTAEQLKQYAEGDPMSAPVPSATTTGSAPAVGTTPMPPMPATPSFSSSTMNIQPVIPVAPMAPVQEVKTGA